MKNIGVFKLLCRSGCAFRLVLSARAGIIQVWKPLWRFMN